MEIDDGLAGPLWWDVHTQAQVIKIRDVIGADTAIFGCRGCSLDSINFNVFG